MSLVGVICGHFNLLYWMIYLFLPNTLKCVMSLAHKSEKIKQISNHSVYRQAVLNTLVPLMCVLFWCGYASATRNMGMHKCTSFMLSRFTETRTMRTYLCLWYILFLDYHMFAVPAGSKFYFEINKITLNCFGCRPYG